MRSINTWQASAILNRSPKGQSMGFDYSLNPYRGCSHACRYCYARESHTYLDLNVAEDFEQKLFVKENLADRMRDELRRIPLSAVIAIGTVTDPYQPLEGRHHLTRTALELLAESGHAFTITTKSPLVERDLDMLTCMGRRRQAGVHISITSLDRTVLQQLEPGASPPARRIRTIRRLKECDIPVGAFIAPIVPGVTDGPHMLDELFSAVADAGADWAMTSTTRLSPAIRGYFIEQVERFNPDAAERIRMLYGPAQYVDGTYRRTLNQLLDSLYHRHGLGRHSAVLIPHQPQKQMAFLFD